MKADFRTSRRQLLKVVVLGTALAPLVDLGMRTAMAADAPLLTEDDPTAKALKYVPDASKATGAKPGSKCANCNFFQGAPGANAGPCQIFPGKAVKAAGWCVSWAAKPN
ncbi:MAG: high-potential iron-sulfur protein [Proteobacteria bacterium]|nr:high-potential iron-sulfur protein [Pseudomonadota bacterium]